MSLMRVDIDVCWTKNVPICYIITPWKYQVSQCGSKKLMRYWQFHIIKWKKSKVLSHLRDFRIETYLEKACYLGSLWLVGSQETQKWTKIKSAILTKMRHWKPMCTQTQVFSCSVLWPYKVPQNSGMEYTIYRY